ncbi:MAG TPA: TraB/GumN family protein [Bacteroidales bacterium]|nr:TraB/GumN family protein [Bacteroidales bacterium]
MLKKLLLLTSILSFGCFCFAQRNSLLWQVSGNGLSQNSYIFGTIHMIKKQDFFISDVVKEKLSGCQSFITEIDMNIPITQQLEIAKKMYLPEGKTLKDYLTEDEFQRFRSIMIDTLQIKKQKFEKYIRLKPFFLSAVVSKHIAGKVKAYERELYKIAKNKGIPSDGLESFDLQFSLVDAQPLDEQAKSLVTELNDYKKAKQQLDDMIAAYKQQDLDKLYEYVVKEAGYDSEFSENFIFKRNQAWILLIEEKIKNRSCFIAVGSAHLPGSNGVLNLLEQKGYTITAIK